MREEKKYRIRNNILYVASIRQWWYLRFYLICYTDSWLFANNKKKEK